MKWFKHSTSSHDDPDLSDAWDKFGDAGPTIFWVILEIYGDEFNSLSECGNLDVSIKFLERKLRRKLKKFEKILDFFEKRQRIHSEIKSDRIILNIPKFLKLASNWTVRSPAPTEAPTEVTLEAPPAIEEEVEEEKKKKKKEGSNFVLPDWVPRESWDGFVESRKKKKGLTDRAKTLIINKLYSLKAKGHSPSALLDEAVEKGWMTVYEPKEQYRQKGEPYPLTPPKISTWDKCRSCGKEVLPQDIEGVHCIHCAPRKPLSEIMEKIAGGTK